MAKGAACATGQSRSQRKRISALLRLACRVLGMKRRDGIGLGLLGVARAESPGSGVVQKFIAPVLAGSLWLAAACASAANGIHINANPNGNCVSINDPQDSFATGTPTWAVDGAAHLKFRDTAAECNSANKATQTGSVLFYRPDGVSGVGATSLSLGGELFVNGPATFRGVVSINNPSNWTGPDDGNGPRVNNSFLQMGTDTGAGFRIGSTETTTAYSTDIALGGLAKTDGRIADGTAIGAAIALGNSSRATGAYTTALGVASNATDLRATAVGASTVARGYSSLAAGRFAQSYGGSSVALGRNAITGSDADTATGEGAVAIGFGARAVANNGVALGRGTVIAADVADATAVGLNARAEHSFGVALGANAVTSAATPYPTATLAGTAYSFAGGAPNATVSVGSVAQQRQIINVGAGRISADSTDAVNGSQMFAAYSEIGKVSRQASALEARDAELVKKDLDLEDRLNKLPRGGTRCSRTGCER